MNSIVPFYVGPYKVEYVKYLTDISRDIKSDIYSHIETLKMLTDPKSCGYEDNEYNEVLEKAHIMIKIWSKRDDIMSYDNFISYKREDKLNKIGINE